jgi:hypothetical protein
VRECKPSQREKSVTFLLPNREKGVKPMHPWGSLGRVAAGSAIDKDAIGFPTDIFHTPQWHRPLPARGQAANLPASDHDAQREVGHPLSSGNRET